MVNRPDFRGGAADTGAEPMLRYIAVAGALLVALPADAQTKNEVKHGPWEQYQRSNGTTSNPFDRFDRSYEKLGPGPHTLVITGNRDQITQINYKTGSQCQRAKDSVRRQAMEPIANGLTPAMPALTAICVPR